MQSGRPLEYQRQSRVQCATYWKREHRTATETSSATHLERGEATSVKAILISSVCRQQQELALEVTIQFMLAQVRIPFCSQFLFSPLLQDERKHSIPPDDDSDMPMIQWCFPDWKSHHSRLLEELSLIARAIVFLSAQSGDTGEEKGF